MGHTTDENAGLVGCVTRELPEQQSPLTLATEEAEVVLEQQDRVEALTGLEGAVEGSQSRDGQAAPHAISTARGDTSIPTTSWPRL